MVRARTDSQRGSVLIAVVGVVMVLLLAIFAKWAMLDMERKLGKQTGVNATLGKIDAAMVNFVAQHKRLPCPANGTLASGTLNAGVEMLSAGPPPAAMPAKGTCNPANQIDGVVPWVTLGLKESDTIDPWNGRITYRVFPPLAMQAQAIAPSPIAPVTAPYGLMDMTHCDSSILAVGAPAPITGLCGGFNAAGGCTQCAPNVPPCDAANLSKCVAPASYLANKGLDVWNGVGGAAGWATRENNPSLGTGAAYVIISHGPTGAGAYNVNGIYQQGAPIPRVPPPGTQAAGTDEIPNLNNQALALPSSQATSYRHAQFDETRTPTNFDDYLSHPTIRSVLEKANLGPRAH